MESAGEDRLGLLVSGLVFLADPQPAAEHSTSVYSGLLRFNDVMIDFPIPEAFIGGDGEKTRAKFEREIKRRTFEHSGLRKVTLFLYNDHVRDTWLKFQAVGEGSRECPALVQPLGQRSSRRSLEDSALDGHLKQK